MHSYSLRSLLGLVLLAPGLAAANVGDIPRTDQSISIDGAMDEEAWQNATQISLDFETRPGENVPAKVRTVAYLIEDGTSLFVAFKAEDPDPSLIRAYLRDRDSAYRDDFVGITVDTYGDERRAFEFFANPLGVQMDLTYDDINGNEDDSWNAIWDSAGQINDDGYIVEMEIPLSQLRFPRVDGKQTWGIDLLRFYPREHRYRLSNNPQDRSVNCYLCQLVKIQGLPDAEPSEDLEIVPTLTASQVDSTDDPGVAPLTSGDTDTEVGVTVRWGITPDMTASLAINPDFSQVEADVAQLDVNNQFALFFPETRPFFLEGADYFRTPIRAIFTRTVADPSVGLKFTGKRGDNTWATFAAQDEITNLIFPGATGSDAESLSIENTSFVGRYARSFGEASSIGAILTTRTGDDYHNHVGGVDLRWRITDNHSVQFQHLQTDTEYPDQVAIDFDQPLGSFGGNATFLGYNYSSRNLFVYLRHQDRNADFRADAGFVPRVDISQQVVGMGYEWYGDESDWWREIELSGDWDIAHNDAGEVIEREIEGYFEIEGPLQSEVEVGLLKRERLFDGTLFEEQRVSVFGEVQPIGGLQIGMWTGVGETIDFANSRLADEVRFEPFVNWNVNRNLFARLDATLVSLETQDGEKIFDAELYDVRLTWQFNVRSFLRFTTQIQDVSRNPAVYTDTVDAVDRGVGRQLLFSYKVNPQTVFFLGYSDSLIEDDTITSLETTDRTWFMKIGYAWTP
ncbi:MAG: DUF5916 domain-containing protein [Woeseiaceae bacterium]|nr:DUF5916 domain-containing protein [Woeseiaceae bacterium]